MNCPPTIVPPSALLVASVTGVALLLTGCADLSGNSGVASGTSAPSPTTSRTGTSVDATTGTADAATDGTSGATAGATTNAKASPRPVPTTIPADLTLPSEGEDGWTETSNRHNTPCPGVELTFDAASDSRTIERSGPEYHYSETLAVFPDAQAAVEFMAGLEEDAQGCDTRDAEGPAMTVEVEPLQGRWGQGLLVWNHQLMDQQIDGEPVYAVGSYLLAARNGNAVAISLDNSHFVYRAEPEAWPPAVEAAREPLDELAPQLCRFTEAGC